MSFQLNFSSEIYDYDNSPSWTESLYNIEQSIVLLCFFLLLGGPVRAVTYVSIA